MQTIPFTALTLGQTTPVAVGNAPVTTAVVVWNESPYALLLQFMGAGSATLPPWTADRYNASGSMQVTPNLYSSSVNVPSSYITINTFGAGESVPGTYPVALARLTNVGNQIQTSGAGGTQFIKDDGSVPATSIIEATPNDQAVSAWALNNDASGTLQVLSAAIQRIILSIVRGNATSSKAAIQIGDSGDTSITTLYGTVGAGSVVPGSVVSGAVANATSATIATSATSASQIASTTSETLSDAFGFPVASSNGKAMRFCVSFNGTGSGTFNHAMIGGVTPNFVELTCKQTNGSQTMGFDSVTSTTVHVTTGAGFPWVGLAGVV